MDLLTLPIQFILLAFLVKDQDVKWVGLLMSVAFAFSFLSQGHDYFYIRNAAIDMYLILCTSFLYDARKKLLLYIICWTSLSMNVYEGMSYYQTIIYPYRDVIQWWMVEFMFIILAWKCEWRMLDVKPSGNNYQAGGRVVK